MGVPVFNSARSIELSDDKIATYQALASGGIPIPKTMIQPKLFHYNYHHPEYIEHIIDKSSFPMIIKDAHGSCGEQVYLIHTKQKMLEKMQGLGDKSYVLQHFSSSSYGMDARLHVVGDDVVAAMKRHNTNDFRANITSGRSMEACTAKDTEISFAVRAARV